MCLMTLHDKVRSLGLGALYERHWGPGGGFRDLFDAASAEWRGSAVGQKVVDLKAFAAAGISVEELVGHYRETYGRREDGDAVLAGLPEAIRAYRDAGFTAAEEIRSKPEAEKGN
jgi:hypothetical protein